MNRAVCMAVLAATAALAVPVDGQTPADAPWWPAQVQSPADHDEGWSLRVPVRVGEDGQVVQRGELVQVHLDFGQLLKDTPWPARQVGTQRLLTSFELDPDSVRIVRYGPDWSTIGQEVPAKVHTGWLTPDQTERYGHVQHDFDPARWPLLTVEWRTEETLSASAPFAHYMVYADTVANGGKPSAPAPAPRQQASLDSLYWAGPGWALYGYHPGSQQNLPTLSFTAQAEAEVTVYSYRGSAFPRLDSTPGQPNPVTVHPGQITTYSLGPAATHFLVRSDEAVTVLQHPMGRNGGGIFVPGVHGSYRDDEFIVPPMARTAVAWLPPDATQGATVCQGHPNPDLQPPCSFLAAGDYHSIPLIADSPDPDNPIRVWATRQGAPAEFFVQYQANFGLDPMTQAPTTYGAPRGTEFMAVLPVAPNGGFETTVIEGGQVGFHGPDGPIGAPRDAAPMVPVAVGAGSLQQDLQMPNPPHPNRFQTIPLRMEATADEGVPDAQTLVGRSSDASHMTMTPFGGVHGMDWILQKDVAVYGLYDGTTATLTKAGEVQEFGMARDLVRTFSGDDQPYRLVTSKPVIVGPLPTEGSNGDIAFLSGMPDLAPVEIYPADYRGYGVQLKHANGVDPAFFNAVPGTQLSIPLDVSSFARWNGQPTPDTISITAVADPPEWTDRVHIETPVVSLEDASPRRVVAVLDVPADTSAQEEVRVTLRATSETNDAMFSQVTAAVRSRQVFDVLAWWGETPTPSTTKTLAATVLPDSSTDFPFHVANSGSGVDDIVLRLGQVPAGWSARILQDGADVDRIENVPGGDAVGLVLRLTSDKADGLAAISLPIEVSSGTSPAKVELLRMSARLSLGQSVELRIDDPMREALPGETVTIPVRLVNSGADVVTLDIEVDPRVPIGWQAALEGIQHQTISLVSGQELPLHIRIDVPADAPAHAFGSVLLTATGANAGDGAADALSVGVAVLPSGALSVVGPAQVSAPLQGNVTVALAVHNEGNGPATYRLLPQGLPPGWSVDVGEGVVLSAGETGSIEAHVEVPEGVLAGQYTWRMSVQGDDGSSADIDVLLDVGAHRDLAWADAKGSRLAPDESWQQQVVLTNHGNTAETVTFDVLAPSAWRLAWSPAQAAIEPGKSVTLEVQGVAPEDPGQALITVLGAGAQGTARTSFTMEVEQAAFRLEEMLQSQPPQKWGDIGFVLARFHNPTNISLEDASVRIVIDGEVADEIAFGRVGPASHVVAALQWSAASTTAPRMVWSVGGQEVGELAMSAPEPLPSTKEAPLPVFVTLAALALVWRWRR